MSSYAALSSRKDLIPLTELQLAKTKRTTSPDSSFHDVEKRIALNQALGDLGTQTPVFQAAKINLGTNPSHQDTLTIGDDTYEFINTGTGTVVADDAYVAVAIGGSAALTLVNLLAAINGTAAAAHATITKADTVTPAIGVGTMPVYGFDLGSSVLAILYSTRQGHDPNNLTMADWASLPSALPDKGLTDGLTASVAWSHTSLDELYWFNPMYSTRSMVSFKLTLVAADLTAGLVRIYLPEIALTPAPAILLSGYTSTGVQKMGDGDTVTWDATNGAVVVTFDAGDSSDWVATDVLHFIVAGNASLTL